MKGYVALAEQLLAARACIDAKDDQGYDAYTFATINDQRPMKRLLRPVDAVINNCGDLAEAARDGNVEAAEHFVKVSPESINSKDIFGLTPLHDAAERGYPGVAKVLLEARASIHDKTHTSRTPLHWTAENGHPSVAKLLLEARAHTEAKNQWGLTPLHETARQGHAGVAQLLLPAGADIEAKDAWGRTPLHWAPQLGHLSVAQLLLGHNADLNATDRDCLTPLHFAAQSGRCDAVEMLLDQNADATVQDRAGHTPYDKAESNGHQKVMELLGSIHVAWPSGRSVRCRRASTNDSRSRSSVFGSLAEIREEAEQQLGQRIGYMVTSDGKLLCDEQTLEEAMISAGDTVTAVAVQPLVMFALYETHENDVYEKMLAVEQCLTHRGVNTILHHERKTQSELNEDLERLKKANGVLLHVASAGFELERCHELNYALDNDIETLCLKTEEQYLPEHRKDTKKGERVGPVERMLAAADVVNCVGLTAEDIAMQLLKHLTAPKSPTKSQAERTIAGNTKKEAQELPSFVAYEQDGVLLEMAESIELKYKPRLEISEKLHDKVVSMLPDGVRLLSPIVSLTPEGEKFNPPIRCIFPASNGAAKAFRATPGRLEELEELEEAIFHGGYCEVSLDHFSCVFAVGSPLPLVATGYLRSESKVGKIVLCTLNCERCEKIVKHQKDFEEGVNSFRACGEPVVLGLTSLNESVKLLHDKTELKIEQVDPTCPRLPPFVSTDFLVGGPEPENGAFTIQVERDSTVTYKHLFQFSFPTLHAEPQASSSTGPNQMVPLVLGMPQRTHLMLSGRFSTPEKCEYMKSLKGVLEGKGVHCYLVEAGPGDEFGFQTMEGLACAKAMLAVCCEEYGAYTGAGYETYYEVKYAWDHKLPIIPLRLCEVYPPQPERKGAIQNGFVFHKSLVRIEGRGRSIQEVAVDIEKSWKRMAKLTQVSL
eukprot:symbB.v1.2.033844.t1/scaffold4261.1/size42272/3